MTYSSLDDAIDFLNSTFSTRLRALYAFADPKAAKYLAQFIRTDVSFVNHIPLSLLGSFI
jgi:aldehyde dehydrogenase (NAD+)